MSSLVQNQMRRQLAGEMTRFKSDVFQILENSIIQEKTDMTSMISEIDFLKQKLLNVEKQSIINSQIPQSANLNNEEPSLDPSQLQNIDKKIELMKLDLLNELDKHTSTILS